MSHKVEVTFEGQTGFTIERSLDPTFATNGYYITNFTGGLAPIILAADGSIFVAGGESYLPPGSTSYAAEMVVGKLGLGARLYLAGQVLETEQVFAVLIVLATLGIVVTKIQDGIDFRLGRWRLA